MDKNSAHQQQLAASGIREDVQDERGYCSIQGRDQWTALGRSPISKQFIHVDLVFPILRLGHPEPYTWVLRPDRLRLNRGCPIKYEWPKGLLPCFDVLPRYRVALSDPAIPLWFTKGAKKANVLTTVYGDAIVPVNLNGVWGFRGANQSGNRLVLPDVDEVAWNGRQVVLAFDHDVVRKVPVATALRRLATLQSGLVQARIKLTTHPQTSCDLFLPQGWAVINGTLALLGKSGDPHVVYSGLRIASAIGVDLDGGAAMLTVLWQSTGSRRGSLTVPKAELSTRQGILSWLCTPPDVPVHESNARDVASYLIEFTQENLGALPRITTSARLGLMIGEGLVLPDGSVGYSEPVQYAGHLPIWLGSDTDTSPSALQAICAWPLRRLRGETVAYRKADDLYWRVPTGTPPFESQIGKSTVQIYGRTWLRHGLIRSLDGRPSKMLGALHRTTAAAICNARSVLGWPSMTTMLRPEVGSQPGLSKVSSRLSPLRCVRPISVMVSAETLGCPRPMLVCARACA